MTAIAAMLVAIGLVGDGGADGASPFARRGYYLTFTRMPTYDLDDWKRIVDVVREDGGDTLVLWTAGAFRSSKYPITWKYNQDHENIRAEFLPALIRHARERGVRVLLGLTPFGYDGANQYALERPDLKATGADGKPTTAFGIGCWGWNLCPSKADSQRFMLDYAREMVDAHPEADGLLIESSDYAACHCPNCDGRFFDREFEFVKAISDHVWARRADAEIIVFPHYFSGADVPGLGTRGAKLPFDPRWSLVFTPHSAPPAPSLAERARGSYWWDDSPARRGPREIRDGARRARDLGATGYVPSFEAFSFVSTGADEGAAWLKGRRQIPLGFDWLAPGDPPYDELLARVNRIAYREFSRDPDLEFDAFRDALGRELLGEAASSRDVEDLLALQALFNGDRTWCQPATATSPERVRALAERGELTDAKRAEIREALDRLRELAARRAEPKSAGEREMARIARRVLDRSLRP